MNKEDKLNEHYSVKTISVKTEDIDETKRIVKGYFASFNTLDSDYDVIRKGAFKKSIQENGPNSAGNRRIAHLRNHDWDRQIGKILELYEDEKGLVFVSQLGRSTEGNDALLDYQDGILREHSIGFNYIADKMKFIEESDYTEGGHYEINEVRLWEGSGVTFGSNSLTPVLDAAKGSGDYKPVLDKIQELEEGFLKALKHGKGTDLRLEQIEARFKQIQQLRNSLTDKQPFDKNTDIERKSEEAKQEQQKKILLFNLSKD